MEKAPSHFDNWERELFENRPKGWKFAKSQFLVDRQVSDVLPTDEIVTVFRDGEVTLRANRRIEGFTYSEKEIGYHHIEPGDLAIHKMDGGFGAIGISDSAGKVSPVVNLYRSESFDLRYVAYFLRAAVATGYIESLQKGIRERSTEFDHAQFSNFYLLVPPLKTQNHIADFLDKETSEIGTLVGELDEYIEFLEKRNNKVLIDETKIFDQDIPTTRLGWHARVELGKTIQGEQQSPADVLQKYVRAGNIQPDGRFEGEEKTMWFTPKESEMYSLKKGDVLIVEGGAGFGRSLTLEKDLVNWGFQNHIIRVRPDNGWDSKFIDYVIRAYKAAGYIDLLTVGATIPGFSSEKAKKLKVPFLTLEEQEEIVQDISRELSETNRIVEECTELKEILLKRRQVLITDVVTGKVEV